MQKLAELRRELALEAWLLRDARAALANTHTLADRRPCVVEDAVPVSSTSAIAIATATV